LWLQGHRGFESLSLRHTTEYSRGRCRSGRSGPPAKWLRGDKLLPGFESLPPRLHALVAQRIRASPCGGEGRAFESRRGCQTLQVSSGRIRQASAPLAGACLVRFPTLVRCPPAATPPHPLIVRKTPSLEIRSFPELRISVSLVAAPSAAKESRATQSEIPSPYAGQSCTTSHCPALWCGSTGRSTGPGHR
jgi:hypothetical protein